jgi:DNA-directed RNA polymerase specialized sigma24 family protein
MAGETDEELMLAVVDGDVRAFGKLVERHRQNVMRSAFNLVRDAGEAEDVVQEAFERVWGHRLTRFEDVADQARLIQRLAELTPAATMGGFATAGCYCSSGDARRPIPM